LGFGRVRAGRVGCEIGVHGLERAGGSIC